METPFSSHINRQGNKCQSYCENKKANHSADSKKEVFTNSQRGRKLLGPGDAIPCKSPCGQLWLTQSARWELVCFCSKQERLQKGLKQNLNTSNKVGIIRWPPLLPKAFTDKAGRISSNLRSAPIPRRNEEKQVLHQLGFTGAPVLDKRFCVTHRVVRLQCAYLIAVSLNSDLVWVQNSIKISAGSFLVCCISLDHADAASQER